MDLQVTYPPDLEEIEQRGAWAALLVFQIGHHLSSPDIESLLVILGNGEAPVRFVEPGNSTELAGETVLGMVFPDGSFVIEPGAELPEGAYSYVRETQGMLDRDMGLTRQDLDTIAWEAAKQQAELGWSYSEELPHSPILSQYVSKALFEERRGRISDSIGDVVVNPDGHDMFDLAIWVGENIARLTNEQLYRLMFGTKHVWFRPLCTFAATNAGHEPQYIFQRIFACKGI